MPHNQPPRTTIPRGNSFTPFAATPPAPSESNTDATAIPESAVEKTIIAPNSTERTVIAAKADNYDFKQQYSAPVLDDTYAELSLPSGTAADTAKALRDTPNLKLENNPKLGKYLNVIQSGLEVLPFAEGLVSAAQRADAHYVQSVPSAVGELQATAPRFKKKEGVKYTGESARHLMRSALKLGTVFHVPLWHSGFWVTLRSPSEGELLELYRTITADKAQLGRSTYGLLFANTTVYTNRALLDFVIDNVYETSLKLPENEDLRKHIKMQDLSILIWGLACATWPNGFVYNRGCIADIDKCQHVVTAKLNLTKLLATDMTRLTERQISHMTNRQRGAMDLEAIKRYQEDFIQGHEKLVVLNDSLSMVLEMPSASEYIDAGYKWIGSIEDRYARAMTIGEESREDYLMQHAQATSMRQYAHYVKKLIVDGEEIDELEDVDALLNEMSSSNGIRDPFMKACAAYLDESVISLIAIPTYECPSCGLPQKKAEPGKAFGELIPLDVSQAFFPLLIQKLRQIQER